jgi:hypothetical protein
MKKRLVLVPALLAISLVSGCNLTSKQEGVLNVSGTNDEVVEKLATQAVLGLSSLNVENMNFRRALNRGFDNQEVNDIKEVLAQVEVFLSKDNSLKIKELNSDKEEYSKKLELSFFEQEISLYFNDVLEKEYQDRYDFDNEQTKITSFKGIAIYGDQELDFTFVKEKETEIGESSEETTLRLYEDNANYIEISQENESEGFEKENGYSYKEVKDSKVAVDFEINVQDELLFREVEVELNNVEYTFKYENVDNFEYIRVEVENRDIETRGLFKRVQVTNEDGSKSTYYEYVS